MLDSHQKVFGLGLSKTGTSSLTDALNILGIKSVHYPHDDRTFDELRGGNYNLSILEQYQGIVDIPVAPFYAQLDGLYPKSKFILTTREKNAWLASCDTHWRLMIEWRDNFPQFKRFHEFISACVYGTLSFNPNRFAYVYDTHVKNVYDYFENRPDDFLVIDICAGEAWEKLCPFLGMEIPDCPFPHANEWMHLLMQASKEAAEIIPKGETYILVDEQGFGSQFVPERRSLPFLERDGIYWGAPPDAETAIRELERLRNEKAARFVVFGFPAFWWLDYYKELHNYLNARFNCVLENSRLVIYDLHLSMLKEK